MCSRSCLYSENNASTSRQIKISSCQIFSRTKGKIQKASAPRGEQFGSAVPAMVGFLIQFLSQSNIVAKVTVIEFLFGDTEQPFSYLTMDFWNLSLLPVLPFLLLATAPLLSSRSARAAPPRQRGIMLGTPLSGRRLYQEDRLGASQEDHLPHSQHSGCNVGFQVFCPVELPCHGQEVCFYCLNAGWSPVQCCCTRPTVITVPKTEHKPSAAQILASAFTTNNFPLWSSASFVPRYKMYTCYSLLPTDPFSAVFPNLLCQWMKGLWW